MTIEERASRAANCILRTSLKENIAREIREALAEHNDQCAQVAEAEERQMKKRMPASDVDAQYKDGYVDGAHACAGFIRALATVDVSSSETKSEYDMNSPRDRFAAEYDEERKRP